MERISIWFTRGRSSVSVADAGGAVRETSARTFVGVLANMHDDDRRLLVAFCTSVIAAASGDVRRLEEF